MDRRLLRVLALCLFVSPLCAQIISVELANPKLEKKYAKWLITLKGKKVICGYPLSGVTLHPEFKMPQKPEPIELAVPDPARPERQIISQGRNGEVTLVARDRKCTIGKLEWKMDGRKTVGVQVPFRKQTIIGLRDEYLRKRDRMKNLEKEWKRSKRASPEWFQLQRRLISEIDSLATWLRSTVFPKAARKLEKQYRAQIKKAGKDASAVRLETAKKSKRDAEVDPRFIEETKKIPGGRQKWGGRESQHCRIITWGGKKAPKDLDKVNELGESIIEHFRTNFIDPLLSDGEADPVAPDVFIELVFCPDDQQFYNRLYETYYGGVIANDRHRNERLQVPGRVMRRGENGRIKVSCWRTKEGIDVEGIMASHTGKQLADLTYNFGRGNTPAWFSEAWGHWVSFEHIARNSVNSIAWSTADYARKDQDKKKEATGVGMRDVFNRLALEEGPSLSNLMAMTLVEMKAPDLAKSWSFLDWMIVKKPKELAPFMRALCEAFQGRKRTDLEAFRPKLHEIFGVEEGGRDIYKVIDEEWRAYAAREQARKSKKKR